MRLLTYGRRVSDEGVCPPKPITPSAVLLCRVLPSDHGRSLGTEARRVIRLSRRLAGVRPRRRLATHAIVTVCNIDGASAGSLAGCFRER